MTNLLDIFGFLAVLLRGLILALQSIVGGGLVFALFVDRGEGGAAAARSCRRLLLASAIGLALVEAANVAADSLILMTTADLRFAEVAGANFFVAGVVAALLATAIAGIAGSSRIPASRGPLRLALGLALGILAASVATSHAAARLDDRLLPLALTALHHAATACWIGGLPYLLLTVRRAAAAGGGTATAAASASAAPTGPATAAPSPSPAIAAAAGSPPAAAEPAAARPLQPAAQPIPPSAVQSIVARFSRLAQGSVVTLVAAGLGLSWLYVGTPAAVLGTAYGAMVTAKVSLLVLLLALGALNQSIVQGAATGNTTLFGRLRRYTEAEIGIGFTVILAAASLTSQPPASDLARDQIVPLSAIAARLAPHAPRLVPPPAEERLPPALRTAALQRAPGAAAAAAPGTPATPAAAAPPPTAATPTATPGIPSTAATPAVAAAAAAAAPAEAASLPSQYNAFVPGELAEAPTPGERALSEFNHNVSGLVVLVAGLLALGARAGLRWARNWPLAFLGLAVFLLLLADVEYWPLGPIPFWRSFLVAEALQHRLAVLLIVAFAIFERQVQFGRATSKAAALVFPFACFLGGALLLTHSHALANPQDQLLTELSHVPIAVLGVAAGWSRWLELRLPDGPRRPLAWVWPVCLVLIGLILLDYREA